MKVYKHILKVLAVIFIFAAAALLGYWSAHHFVSLSVKPVTTSTRTVKPSTAAYFDEVATFVSEYTDLFNLATSTSRVSLPPVIIKMQEVRGKLENLPYPEEAGFFRSCLLLSMHWSTEGFILFLGEAPDAQVVAAFEKADSYAEAASVELSKLKGGD